MTEISDAETATPQTAPVEDWTTDYDIFDHDYVVDPVPVWKGSSAFLSLRSPTPTP